MNHLLERPFNKREFILLQFLVVCLFLGRAYQGLFFDLPLRTFFWDENLLSGLVTTLTGDTWQNYVTNKSIDIDSIINTIGVSMGLFWLLCAIVSMRIQVVPKWAKGILYAAVGSFIILALLYWKDKFYAMGQLFEYMTQISLPALLVYAVFNGNNTVRFRFYIKIIIAITFVCHGLYAVGYYPQPGLWIQWTMETFHFPDDVTTQNFLKVMGVLDFIAAGLLFFRPTFSIGIWYCILWGFMTAIARVWSNFYVDFPIDSLHQWTYQTLFRLGHGGLPLLLLWWHKES